MQHSPIQPTPDATPPDTNGKKVTIRNFFANNWIPLIIFSIFTYIAICFFLDVQNISHEHLNKTQQLLQEIKEGRDAANETIKEIDSLRNSFSIHGLLLILSLIILVSCFSKPIMKLLNEYPQRVFVSSIALGGILAFSIPQYLYSYKYIGETKDITTSLLTVTGGILAVFTLLKTHQKSELEREQLDTQKQKDARDHIRQLHNSYSDRFDKAVTELNSGKSKDAFAAVYKLVHLADDWLEYKDLSDNKEDQNKLKNRAQKETQTIIDILCKYIRTMPDEYTEEDLKYIESLDATTQDKLKNESEVRRLIFSEISDRSSTVIIKKDEISTIPGTWSNFDFDFSRAPIFYPLNNLTIEKGNFSSAKFYSNADFSGATFTQTADFSWATFAQNAGFSGATFVQDADFTGANFDQNADFKRATFTQTADFKRATFTQTADFYEAAFTQTADFSGMTFTQKANFNGATFTQNADFSGAIFTQTADFSRAIFTQTADFSWATFVQDAYFAGATFVQKRSFKDAFFKNCAPTFMNEILGAWFSVHRVQEDYIFSVSSGSKPIQPGKAELDGMERQIPVGTMLFDLDSGRISEPAKPIEESDSQEETSSK